MKKIVCALTAVAAVLSAGGYRIPENSINGMALSAANVAHAHGADATYYNPANMAFEDGKQKAEVAVTYIGLSAVTFEGTAPTAGSGVPDSSGSTSEAEHFFVPTFHYVSPAVGAFRFGASMVTPAGLSKRWNDQPARGYAKEFTLETVEFNPTLSYKIGSRLAVAAGARIIYTSGVVQSAAVASRDMYGTGLDYGYNLALSYRPTSALSLAATYRSNVDLHVTGNAKLYYPDNGNFTGTKIYDGNGKVSVPVPAVFQLAAAYTFETQTTVEFVYERDFWSAYKQLDFDYSGSIGVLTPSFDAPIAKDWKDTNVYRLGVTQAIGSAWTGMVGVVFDETPVPEKTLSFELPDSDGIAVSTGARYALNDGWNLGAAVLYDFKAERAVHAASNDNGIDGTFKGAGALLVTLGAEYRF